MRSTGEVMGLDDDLGTALAKAQMAAGGAEKLREIGLRVVQEETFFVEPKLTEAPELV